MVRNTALKRDTTLFRSIEKHQKIQAIKLISFQKINVIYSVHMDWLAQDRKF